MNDDDDKPVALSYEECMLAAEGLHELLKLKREALDVAILNKPPQQRPFTSRDFGIPQVGALIAKLEGDEPREVAVTPTYWGHSTKGFKFTVEGQGDFPRDMLRYDECEPASYSDSMRIACPTDTPIRETRRRVTLTTAKRTGPTQGRWVSFGWRVMEAHKLGGAP